MKSGILMFFLYYLIIQDWMFWSTEMSEYGILHLKRIYLVSNCASHVTSHVRQHV